MKRWISALCCGLLLTASLGAYTAAAESEIRVTDYKLVNVQEGNNGGPFYVYFTLSEPIGNARHFQNYDRQFEPDLPEDSWDFSDALVDAGRKYVTINGNSVGECIEATGSVWSTALLYEKDKKDPSIQYFVMYVALEGTDRTRNDVTIEIKKGLISRENKKFEPFKAVWSSKTQSLEVYREGDAGLSLSEFKAGVGTTQPKATTTRTPNGKPTTAPHGTTASGNSGPDGTTTGPDVSGMTTETPPDGTQTTAAPAPTEWQPSLGKYDITTTDKDVEIDVPNSTITLKRSMKVSELLSVLQAVEGYETGVYNGVEPVKADSYIYTGYKYKVRVDDQLIGNFLLKAPAPSGGTVWLIVGIAAGVLVVAGGVLAFLLIRKKKSAMA